MLTTIICVDIERAKCKAVPSMNYMTQDDIRLVVLLRNFMIKNDTLGGGGSR